MQGRWVGKLAYYYIIDDTILKKTIDEQMVKIYRNCKNKTMVITNYISSIREGNRV